MENLTENKYSIIFKEVDGVVVYSTINRVVEAQEGEVVKSFATVQELDDYLSVVYNDKTKKFQIRDVEGILTVYQVDKNEEELILLEAENNLKKIKEYKAYLQSTDWINSKYCDVVMIKQTMTHDEFISEYQEIYTDRELARSDINTLESQL